MKAGEEVLQPVTSISTEQNMSELIEEVSEDNLEEVTEVVNESEETKVVEKQQEKLLIDILDIWKKESDKIKKKCHLKSLKFQGKNRVIDFDSPYLRKYLRSIVPVQFSC